MKRIRQLKRVFIALGLFTASLFTASAHAVLITEDMTMSVKWNFVSAGNSCSGWPAKVGELYMLGSGLAPPDICCPQTGNPYACVAYGGTYTGTEDYTACSGIPVPWSPNDWRPTIYRRAGATVQNAPDWSSYNGNSAGMSTYIPAGTDVSEIRAVTGFTNNQGANCPGMSGTQYCYGPPSGSSAKGIAFDVTKCDEWVTSSYTWCAWSSASVSVKFKPVAGCPSPSPSASPPAGTLSFLPNANNFGAIAVGSSSAALPIQVTNNTGSNLTGCAYTFDTLNFGVTGTSGCANLLNTQSCTLQMTAHPTSAIGGNTAITVQCNSGAGLVNYASGQFVVTAAPTPTPTPTVTPTATPACDLDPGDCNRDTSAVCGCRAGFIKVMKPSGMPPPSCSAPEIAGLQQQVHRAIARRDGRLLDFLKSMLDSLCPTAFAQAVSCAGPGNQCAEEILSGCDGPGPCTKTVTYSSTGAAPPPACTPAPANCQVTVSCPVWTTTPSSSERLCRVTDNCFGNVNSCFPFNQSSFKGSRNQVPGGNYGDILQVGIDGIGPGSSGTAVCIPDCENLGSANSGLKYVWNGPNQGKCGCPIGYVWNTLTDKCVSPATLTGCGEGSASTPPSEVSPYIVGADYVERFRNTVNKKLNCCLNGLGTTAAMAKFDCTDNTIGTPATFDALWASQDDATDGGQLNALVFMNSNSKPLTGFYSVDGKRADQFSEFTATPIQPGRVNAKINPGQIAQVAGTFEATGSPLPVPTGAAWTDLVHRMGDLPAPTSAEDRRNFPILVRAAAIYSCPRNPVTPNTPLKALEIRNGSGGVTGIKCSTASTVLVHIQIRQIWEVAGTAPMKPIDTVLDSSQISGISIDQLIVNKYGPDCGPGRVRQGNACVW